VIDPRIVLSEAERHEKSQFGKMIDAYLFEQIEECRKELEGGTKKTSDELRHFQGKCSGLRLARRSPEIIRDRMKAQLGESTKD